MNMAIQLIVGVLFMAVALNDAQRLCSSPDAIGGFIVIQNVSENVPPNTVLSQLDIVGSESQITLRMTSSNDYVRFNTSSRELIVIKSFNVTVATPMYMYLNITCTATVTTLYQIVLQIYAMNDNPPSFVNLPYSFNISERTALNTTVFTSVEAIDPDPCDQGYLIYDVPKVAGNPFAAYFSFPVSTYGNLVLMKQLNYEAVQAINLTITVRDNGSNLTILGQIQPQHTATTTVMINVIPADDYNPVFSQTAYTAAVNEDTQQGSSIAVVGAILKYAPSDAKLVYSIVQDSNIIDWTYFVIDNQTGVVTSSPSSNFRLSQNILAFEVQATRVNQSYRYGRALVKLNVVRNIRPLSFTQPQYSVAIDDATANGTLVVTVTTVDGSSRPFYYFTTPVDAFVINDRTGEIRTQRMLNYRATSLYNLTVAANDTSSTVSCLVVITVTKLNKYNPLFAQSIYTFNISKATSFVGQASAKDEDPGATLTYSLVDSSGFFTVDNTGRITCACSSATFFSNSSYGTSNSMLMIAVDDGQPPRQGSALVVVYWTSLSNSGQEASLCPSTDQQNSTRSYYIAVIVLGVIAGLLLIICIVLAICLCTRSRSKANPPPRVTIEIGQTPQKPATQGSRKVVGGFEVTKEYGPYFSYESADSVDNITAPSSSVLNSSDKLQKLKIYHSVPTQRVETTTPRNGNLEDSRAHSQMSNISRKQVQHISNLPYSTTSLATSSVPSSRVERYQFEDDAVPTVSPSARGARSNTPPPQGSTSKTHAPVVGFHSAPGPRKGGRIRASVAALRDSPTGDTSSTETLVTPVAYKPKSSNVSFVENTGGYLSSQEGMDVSMSALAQNDGESGITVYY